MVRYSGCSPLLQKSYYDKVKMIYIDPPYNTGNEFIYPDNFREGLQDYLRYSGQVDGDGLRMSTNTESEGRYHSNWLNMMYPRLFLARNLLRDDGVIFVSIDDHEAHNLRLLMNEVFGEENFFGTLVRRAMHTVRNSSKDFNLNADYVLTYGRNKGWFAESPTRDIRKEVDKTSSYPRDDNDGRGRYKLDPISARNFYTPYQFRFSNGVVWSAPDGSYPRYSQDTLRQYEMEGGIVFDGKEPRAKRYLREVQAGQPPDQILAPDDVGFNADGTREIRELFGGGGIFSQPKPSTLVSYLLSLLNSPDAIVLDFFAGSGTTAHAVMQLNAYDGGSRRFILVQLPERIDPDDIEQKVAIDLCNSLDRPHVISEITKERVRRAGHAIAKERSSKLDLYGNELLDLGFRTYKLTTSNFTPWDGDPTRFDAPPRQPGLFPTTIAEQLALAVDNVLPGRTSEDILAELLLKSGFELTASVERLTLTGTEVYSVAEGALLVCLERELTLDVIEAMVARDPAQIICLDAGFHGNDQLKVNAVQTIKTGSGSGDGKIEFKVV